MKINVLLAALVGCGLMSSAVAGPCYCPPECEDKCPVDCCEDLPGTISVGYDTNYLFYGVNVARDGVWADVNYTFDVCGLDLNVGVWHYSSQGSGAPGEDAYGDETDLYAALSLPSICGFDHSIGYRHMFYPTTRPNVNSIAGGGVGDSQGEIIYTLSREIGCGITAAYRGAWDFNVNDFQANPGNGNESASGAWMHDFGLSKTVDISDCLALDLTGGVLYSDNYWLQGPNAYVVAQQGGAVQTSGFNSYYLRASLPIAVGRCATLTPYVGYNGTPDTWVADGLTGPDGNGNQTMNSEVLHGGVSLSVGF